MAHTRIFVVDDDPVFIKLLEHELAGYSYRTYNSGEACLADIHRKPRYVLLDFSLGGLNGLDTLKRILQKSPKSKVIILTALDDPEVKEKCLAAGAYDYIVKDPDGLQQLRQKHWPQVKRKGLFGWLG